MLYAKVVLGLAVPGPFDYSVPRHLLKRVKPGARVRVTLRAQKMIGYVVGLTPKTGIKNVKPILELIDDRPILNKAMLELTRRASDYYCCSWGEMIEAALPEDLRRGAALPQQAAIAQEMPPAAVKPGNKNKALLIHDLSKEGRWEVYLKEIKEVINMQKAALMILPDLGQALRAKEVIEAKLGLSSEIAYRKQPREKDTWLKIKAGDARVVIGTRSAIFSPLAALGLIIIDHEEDQAYKQEQVPHYQVRQAAFFRAEIEGIRLILGSLSPSLESFYLAEEKKIEYLLIPRRNDYPEIKIVDMNNLPFPARKKGLVISPYLQDRIDNVLNAKGKVLLFFNRKGFANLASCRTCGNVLKCKRCNINLVYHFKEKVLSCHHCNFKMPLPDLCPVCNSGYIRYAGSGTEKIESELSRIFPQAKIQRYDDTGADKADADILIATQAVIKDTYRNFDLVGVIAVDNLLNRLDLRASEKAFAVLTGLLNLTDKSVLIQTRSGGHYCFQAIQDKDPRIFYKQELKQRRQLKFPPYQHTGLIKLRGKNEERVKQAANILFEKLKGNRDGSSPELASVNPSEVPKLRGSYYWQILLKSASVNRLNKFIRINLKELRHSGIIVTVDIDPL